MLITGLSAKISAWDLSAILSWFSTDLVFDLGQVPCLLCQCFLTCPHKQYSLSYLVPKAKHFTPLEIRCFSKAKEQ